MWWPAWRLVVEHVATLSEVECYYGIDDVATANEALDLLYEAQRQASKKRE